MPGNSIEASFGANLAPLKRDFAEAERIAKAGAARVQRAITQPGIGAPGAIGAARNVNFQQVAALSQSAGQFMGAGGARQRANSAAGFARARPGQYLPLDDEAGGGGRRGRGAFGVVGAASAVGVLGGGLAVWKQMLDAATALREKIGEITRLTGPGAFRGVAEMEKNLEGVTAALDEIQKRDIIESQGGTLGLGSMAKKARQLSTGGSDEVDAEQKQTLQERSKKLVGEIAAKQTELNSFEAKGLFLSEKQAALDKEERDHKEQLGQLARKEALSGVAGTPLQDAEKTRSILARTQIERRFASGQSARNLGAGLQSITEGVGRGALTGRAGRLRGLRARQSFASRRGLEEGIPAEERGRREDASREANFAVFEERFQQSESMRGPAGADLRRSERAEGRRRSAFAANDKDASQRRGRGARDQVALGDEPKGGKGGEGGDVVGVLNDIKGIIEKWGDE